MYFQNNKTFQATVEIEEGLIQHTAVVEGTPFKLRTVFSD
jgi:hypothetical protein